MFSMGATWQSLQTTIIFELPRANLYRRMSLTEVYFSGFYLNRTHATAIRSRAAGSWPPREWQGSCPARECIYSVIPSWSKLLLMPKGEAIEQTQVCEHHHQNTRTVTQSIDWQQTPTGCWKGRDSEHVDCFSPQDRWEKHSRRKQWRCWF